MKLCLLGLIFVFWKNIVLRCWVSCNVILFNVRFFLGGGDSRWFIFELILYICCLLEFALWMLPLHGNFMHNIIIIYLFFFWRIDWRANYCYRIISNLFFFLSLFLSGKRIRSWRWIYFKNVPLCCYYFHIMVINSVANFKTFQ